MFSASVKLLKFHPGCVQVPSLKPKVRSGLGDVRICLSGMCSEKQTRGSPSVWCEIAVDSQSFPAEFQTTHPLL